MKNAQVRSYIDKEKIKAREAFKELLKEHQNGKTDTSNFCAAPFAHMYVHSNEGQRVCCMSTEYNVVEDDTELDLKKRWSNDYYKEFRKKFLRNEQPDVCVKCYNLEKAGGRSDRINFNAMYSTKIEPNIETGNQWNAPIDIDVRPGNLCNLKCRMCGPVSSSILEKEVNENEIIAKFLGPKNIKKTDMLMDANNQEFLYSAVDKGQRIKFLGGEPTIMPEIDKTLDLLLEKGFNKVPLHFTTNCTNHNKRFIDKISKFKNISFNYSVDGTGSVVEYIRTPVKFKTIDKTIRLYHEIAKDNVSEISFTWQAYNLFNLYDTVVWAKSIGITIRPEILRQPEWSSIRNIPLSIRTPYIYSLIKKIEPWKDRYSNRVVPALYQMMNDKEEYNPIHLARATKSFDKVRKQHIKDYVPEVYEIIKKDYDDLQV